MICNESARAKEKMHMCLLAISRVADKPHCSNLKKADKLHYGQQLSGKRALAQEKIQIGFRVSLVLLVGCTQHVHPSTSAWSGGISGSEGMTRPAPILDLIWVVSQIIGPQLSSS